MKWVVAVLVLVNVLLVLWAVGPGERLIGSGPVALAPVNPGSMRLLDPAAGVPAGAGTTVCIRIGPFYSHAAAAEVQRTVRGMGLEPRRTTVEEREIRAQRVYLGPFASAAELTAARGQLRELSVDHYVIDDAGQQSLSLGLFTQTAMAERYLDHLAAQGVQAGLRPEMRSFGPTLWLEVRGLAAGDDRRQRLALAPLGDPRARVREVPCGTPAAGG